MLPEVRILKGGINILPVSIFHNVVTSEYRGKSRNVYGTVEVNSVQCILTYAFVSGLALWNNSLPSSIHNWAPVGLNWGPIGAQLGPTGAQLGPIWNAAWELSLCFYGSICKIVIFYLHS